MDEQQFRYLHQLQTSSLKVILEAYDEVLAEGYEPKAYEIAYIQEAKKLYEERTQQND